MTLIAMMDPIFILLYRMTGYAYLDFVLGTFFLALGSVILGMLAFKLVVRLNRRHIDRLSEDLDEKHRLSMAALEIEDQKAYRAINDQASEAYGHYYFNMSAHSFVALWPVPFVLAWMQSRFWGVEFQLPHPVSVVLPSIGYLPIFVLCYILARIAVKNLRLGLGAADRGGPPPVAAIESRG